MRRIGSFFQELKTQHFWYVFISFLFIVIPVWTIVLVYEDYRYGPVQEWRETLDASPWYQDDVQGGESPGETMTLFVAALSENDIEVAAQYFLPDAPDVYRSGEERLTAILTGSERDAFLKGLRLLEPKPVRFPRYFFEAAAYEDSEMLLAVDLVHTGTIWKIREFRF